MRCRTRPSIRSPRAWPSNADRALVCGEGRPWPPFPEALCGGSTLQTGPTHGFHQCGIKLTGLDSVNPYISSLLLHTLETLICLYMALLLVELTLT